MGTLQKMWSKNISYLILGFNTIEVVTDQSQIRSFSKKKDKLMGRLGEEKNRENSQGNERAEKISAKGGLGNFSKYGQPKSP